MRSKRHPDIDPAAAARRHAQALAWRADWRRETAERAAPAPEEPTTARRKADGADFASAMARAELGRSYLDPRTNRQTVENGAVVMKSGPPRRRT